MIATPDGEESKRLAVTNELGQRREEIRVFNPPSNYCYPEGEMAEKRKGSCINSESRRSHAVQFARKTKSLELVTGRKNLVKRSPPEDTADVEVSKVLNGNGGRGEAPCTVLDGQRLNSGLDIFEELVKIGCISTLCGKGEIF